MRPYSIMTLSFHGRIMQGELSLAELFRGLAEVGIEGVEPATGLRFERAEQEAEVPRLARDCGLDLTAYDAIANLVHPEAAERQAAIDSVHRDLERCHAWGIPLVMVAGSRVHPDLSPTDCRRQVADGMNACVAAATAAGITLLVESFGVQLELHASSAQLKEVMDQCDPAVQTTFDMGNFVLGGDRPIDALEEWLPRLKHVHVKDFAKLPADSTAGLPARDGHRYRGCRLGEGVVDVAAVVTRLRDAGYQGALSLEMGGQDLYHEVAADLATLRAAAEPAAR